MARQPKSENVPFLLRLPPDLYAALRDRAEEDTRSINGEIVHLLRQMVSQNAGSMRGRQQESATAP